MELTIYNQRESFSSLYNLRESILDKNLKYLASDLVSKELNQATKIQIAVKKAIKICALEGIDVRSNFKPIYMCEKSQIMIDWKLSFLAKQLVIINNNDLSPHLKNISIEFVINQEGKFVIRKEYS